MPVIRPGLRLRASGKGRTAFMPPAQIQDRLADLPPAASNPGNLIGRYYVPANLAAPAALVVVLHGCTQNAAAYDHGSGWSRLADRHGFALLFPEQQRSNNPMLCFNWFADEDTQRGRGEAASIRAMIDLMQARHEIDPARIFVTGLSAGGAMSSVMLASYPETFAAGAIIAGVAYGCASGAAEAFECMGGRSRGDTRNLAEHVRRASPHRGPWPRIQVWQGSADRTVVSSNADAIVAQWAPLHGIPTEPSSSETVDGHTRRLWLGKKGEALIEQYEIAGMAHGTPLDPGREEGQSGEAGAHMLDVGLSSTDRIAAFFGIAPAAEVAPRRRKASKRESPSPASPSGVLTRVADAEVKPPITPAKSGIQGVIEDALRAAGLMR